MKIIIIGNFPLDITRISGGVESSVYGLSTALANNNEILVADLPRICINDSTEQIDAFRVHRFANHGRHNMDGARRANDIAQWAASQKPDICHLHGTSFVAYKIYQALIQHGLATILTIHGLAHVEKRKALKTKFSIKLLFQYIYQRHYEIKLIKACSNIIVDTPYVAETVLSFLPYLKPNSCNIIPQGIDAHFLEIACRNDSRTILSVGSFSQRKGHLQLLEAFNILTKKYPDVQLTIAGSSNDSTHLNLLHSYIKEHQLNGHVKLLTNVNTDILRQLYSEAHIFALHSHEESQGIVFLEAMATGLPIVATRVGGIPDVVSNQENGFLCGVNHIEEFAEAIGTLLDDTKLWNTMSIHNKTKAKQYIWPIISERVEEIYRTTINA